MKRKYRVDIKAEPEIKDVEEEMKALKHWIEGFFFPLKTVRVDITYIGEDEEDVAQR